MVKRIDVIGGDLRQLTLYRALSEEFENVSLYGFDKLDGTECADNADAIKNAVPTALTIWLFQAVT